jgi:DNA-directed RNA polymerase specialized sigma24 family protein
MSNAEFSLLLTENAEFLRPFAINLTKDHESAKDLYQDTLYRAISNKDKYNVKIDEIFFKKFSVQKFQDTLLEYLKKTE